MRCYFMRSGRIVAADYLKPGSDENLIEQGKTLFVKRSNELYDGFEVWDGTRRLYVHANAPADESPVTIKTAHQ